MAQRVKVSTIAAAAPLYDKGDSDERLVTKMLEYWQQKIARVLPDRPDLIVLPECCDRYDNLLGDDWLRYSATRGDRLLDYFQRVAREYSCYIAYPSLHQVHDASWRNSIRFIDRSGEIIGNYNKNHAVIEETTELGILCGSRAELVECDFGCVAGAICFDLNFDALRLKYKSLQPNLILFCSVYHGGLMQQYWAYSCRAHFVAAVAGLPSAMISPDGRTLATTTNYTDHITATLNLDCCLAHLDGNWEKLRALKKKFETDVTITDPGFLGSVLVTSESDSVSAEQMTREFEIELLDEYLQRSLAHQCNPEFREPPSLVS